MNWYNPASWFNFGSPAVDPNVPALPSVASGDYDPAAQLGLRLGTIPTDPNAAGAPLGIGGATAGAVPGGPTTNLGPSTGLGWNVGTGQLAASGLSALANLWSGMQANTLAKKSLALNERTFDTNLTNQIKTFNTALTDRSTARGVAENQTPDQIAAYIQTNRLTR